MKRNAKVATTQKATVARRRASEPQHASGANRTRASNAGKRPCGAKHGGTGQPAPAPSRRSKRRATETDLQVNIRNDRRVYRTVVALADDDDHVFDAANAGLAFMLVGNRARWHHKVKHAPYRIPSCVAWMCLRMPLTDWFAILHAVLRPEGIGFIRKMNRTKGAVLMLPVRFAECRKAVQAYVDAIS